MSVREPSPQYYNNLNNNNPLKLTNPYPILFIFSYPNVIAYIRASVKFENIDALFLRPSSKTFKEFKKIVHISYIYRYSIR